MTTKPKIQVTKPGTPDTRFDDALAFATEKEAEAPKKSSRPATKEIRQSYDCPQDLKKKVDVFVVGSRMFKTRKEFILQCLKDGLEKYKGQ